MDGLLRGILGILIGAALYSEVYPVLQENLLKVGVYGKLTLPGLVGLNHWAVILPLIAILGGLLLWLDRRGM
jgi:xanthosine utilization system XapX-like protein